MADNVAITAGTGTAIHADEYTHATLGSGKTQLVKLVDGTLDSSTAIAAGGGTEDGALRVTIASDSTGVVSIDDNGSAITVDGTVTANLSATDNAVLDAIESDTTAILADTTTIAGDTTSIDAKIPALGQALAAASVPVVLPSAQITTLTPQTDSLTDTQLRASAVPVSLASVPSHAVTNAGTFAVQVDGSALTSLQLIDDAIYTDGSGTVTKGVAILGQDGTNPQAIKTDTAGELQVDVLTMPTVAVTQSGTWDEVGINDSGNSITVDYATTGSGTATGALRVELPTNGTGVVGINAGTNLVGDVGIQPRTTNGLDTFMASGSDGSSILVATAQAVKASAGKVYGYYLYNPESAVTFVHFYNTASGSVTVGTTSPLFTLQIPPASAANLMSEIGITFGTAITIAATTTAGGNTAPATGVSATIWYK